MKNITPAFLLCLKVTTIHLFSFPSPHQFPPQALHFASLSPMSPSILTPQSPAQGHHSSALQKITFLCFLTSYLNLFQDPRHQIHFHEGLDKLNGCSEGLSYIFGLLYSWFLVKFHRVFALKPHKGFSFYGGFSMHAVDNLSSLQL